jgi:hypothetical protein
VVDSQQENIKGSSVPWREQETPPNPVNPAFDAEARKDFPGLLKRNCRPSYRIFQSTPPRESDVDRGRRSLLELNVLQQALQTIHTATSPGFSG